MTAKKDTTVQYGQLSVADPRVQFGRGFISLFFLLPPPLCFWEIKKKEMRLL